VPSIRHLTEYTGVMSPAWLHSWSMTMNEFCQLKITDMQKREEIWYDTLYLLAPKSWLLASLICHKEPNKKKQKQKKLELKMFYKTQTAQRLSSACTPVTPRLRRNGAICCWMMSLAVYGEHLTMHCQLGWCSSFPVFVPGDLDLWPWHSNSSERATTKHIFPVNLAQIRSAVPEIFEIVI